MAEPGTLRGQLQRGRGEGARRAPAEPGAAELVYDCVRRDPRWDRQVEARDLYLVRLVVRLDLPVEPISAHLFEVADGDDAWRVDLAIDVLVGLARLGRGDAATPLRRYVAGGRHRRWALDAMWAAGDPRLCQGLADQVLARVDDDELVDAVDPAWGPWARWSRTRPRIRAALDERRERRGGTRHAARDRITGASRDGLIGQVRTGDDPAARRLAVAELGRRGDPAVLDLAEDAGLRNSHGRLPGLARALRALGAPATPRARAWVSGGDDVLVGHGLAILAEHGDRGDVDVLLAHLTAAVRAGDWSGTAGVAGGLGRLRVAAAAPALLTAWRETSHSSARTDVLVGLLGAEPGAARACLDEGLDDCEPGVRRIACQAVDPDAAATARIRLLRDDPLEEDGVRAAATTRIEQRR